MLGMGMIQARLVRRTLYERLQTQCIDQSTGGILAMPYWTRQFADAENNYEITAAQDSLIVSILSAGTFFGALLAAPTADLIGRRWGLIASTSIVFNLGVILQTAATERPMFIAGRFFAGKTEWAICK